MREFRVEADLVSFIKAASIFGGVVIALCIFGMIYYRD